MNQNQAILISDENQNGKQFTKFPGGGLELGEGIIDCLKREFMEELNLKIEVKDLLYITDYFQLSAFNPAHQLISIYYEVEALDEIKITTSLIPFDFGEENENAISFRWISGYDISENEMTFPIDKIVAEKIREKITAIPF